MQEFDPESEPPQELFTSSEMKRKEDLSDTREALMDSPYASQRFRISMDQIKPESEEPYDVSYTRRLLKSSIRELETTRRDLPELLMEKLSARFPESAPDSEEDIHTEMSSLLANPSSEGSYDGPSCGVLPPNEGLLQGHRGFDARMFPDVTDKLRMWPASSWAWKQREESTAASPQHERSTNTGEDSLFNYLLSQMKTLVNKEEEEENGFRYHQLGELGADIWRQLKVRANALRHLVARDPLAADVKLTLFASAVFSYRRVGAPHHRHPSESDEGLRRRKPTALQQAEIERSYSKKGPL
ncbi:Protein of unknown function [Gryllus bimaculatus]|nr:Protein of unknown function [Gryllus bimaculatus]